MSPSSPQTARASQETTRHSMPPHHVDVKRSVSNDSHSSMASGANQKPLHHRLVSDSSYLGQHGVDSTPLASSEMLNQHSNATPSHQHQRVYDPLVPCSSTMLTLADHELEQVISRDPLDASNHSLWSAQLANGVNNSNQQEIAPWVSQADDLPDTQSSMSASEQTTTTTPRTRPRSNTATDRLNIPSSPASFSSHRANLKSSPSAASLRPRTPPSSGTISSGILAGVPSTPTSTAKRLINPFSFLKKKSNSILKEKEPLDPTLSSSSSTRNMYTHYLAQPLGPAARLDSSRSPRLHSSSSNSLRTATAAGQTSSTPSSTSATATSTVATLSPLPPLIQAAFPLNPWGPSPSLRPDPFPNAISLQDEQEPDPKSDANAKRDKRRKLVGVRHHLYRDKDRSKNQDDPDAVHVQIQPQEVELSLDMNFDHIDDIVDPSVARQRLIGPMNESIPVSPPQDLGSSNGSDVGLYHPPSTSYPSLADHRQPSFSSSFASSSLPSNESALRGSIRALRFPYGQSSSNVLPNADPQEALANLNRTDLGSISLAEVQPHQPLRRVSSGLRDRTEPASPLSGSPNVKRRGSTGGTNVVVSPAGHGISETRKASITSAHSMRSNNSGISPKTSYTNLAATTSDRNRSHISAGWGLSRDDSNQRYEAAYRFPLADETSASILALRKSSTSSGGQGASSSWMAPDSWAVQLDKSGDGLHDDHNMDDDDYDDRDDTRSLSRDRRGSSSGVSAMTGSALYRSGSSDPHNKVRPDTQDSLDSNAAMSAKNRFNEDPNTGIVPSSRGGGTATSGGAAALSASGKLALHRTSKHRSNTTRPSTAGSVGTTRPSTTTLGSSTTSTEDDSAMAFLPRRDALVLKRPGTATTAQSTTRNHFVRIYKVDSSFATLSCSVTATATEVQTILTRKSLTNDSSAYRLFVRDKGTERPLGNSDKPAQLQRRRLLQAGYIEADGLEDMGRDDLSYLLRFIFRPDSVPTFDSESFGNSEHTFQHLDLQNRNLEMVPIFLYRHADWIVSLDLSDNPMSDLPLDFVQLCTNLRNLRLSNLALKRIPQSVKYSETLTHLDVSNNRLVDLQHINLDNIPELMSIKVQNNRLSDLPPYFASIHTLRCLTISNNRFEQFPNIICDATSLVDLDISFNAIVELPVEISKLVNLERFILAGNSVELLPETMSELSSLKTIDLRRNMIQDISPLLGLPKLQIVQAENNNIKSFEASLGPQLREIELGRNPLSRVKITAFTSCDLTSLDLSSTNMSRLDEDLFPQLPALENFNLDRNQFIMLPETLGELEKLVTLSCNNNLLSTLPESIGKLSRLKELFAHNNNLKTLPNTLWCCESLETINVSSNLLESFPNALSLSAEHSADYDPSIVAARKGSSGSTTQQHHPPAASNPSNRSPLAQSLKKLRLGDNRLTDDVLAVLSILEALEVLNLSFNEIFEIPNYTLHKHTHLRELYVSGNHLSSIPSDDLEHLQELRILHLNGNKLQSLPAELGRMGKLANLDVGNNVLKYNIANWHYDWNWNANPELRYLNLSGNKRLEIKSKLAEIGGRRTNISDFSRLTCLRLLGLMDVTMPLHSNSTPDESDNRRVRTSLSQINQMAYGIADALGKHDNLSVIDVVIPRFRKEENECVFGLFDGRGHGPHVGSRIARHLAEWSEYRISWEIQRLGKKTPDPESIPDVLRRAFLRLQKDYADVLINDGTRKLSEAHAEAAADESRSSAPAIAAASNKHDWRAGASAILAYVVEKTLYIANAGDALAVLSRNGGTAQLISNKHEPFDREETERIRSAEGWVSLRGYVNDTLDVSRSFGYFHLFPIVNAAPAVSTVQLTDSDEFVVIANRVLWQYVSYQTAVDIARTERNDPMIAAQKLRDFAISYGAEESIMVMVISVGDLFFSRQQRNGAPSTALNAGLDNSKKGNRRLREDLPGDRTLARLDREVAPPIGQVALVFTDIKNSTSLWETNGGMQTSMRLHNFLLRRQLRTIGGYEVKTEGDAFMVSFPSVTSALLWCFTVQVQLLQEDWPQEILESDDGKEGHDSSGELIHRGLSVRMGIHWGFPVCEADPITRRMDYFGPMVNRTARISGAADGGQILASKDVITELQTLLQAFDDSNPPSGDGSGSPSFSNQNEDLDEDAFRLMNPNVSRDIVLLRRMGFGISQIGERRLKGLETPELLSLVYPKQLTGRLEQTKTDAPTAQAQVYEPTVQLLSIDQVKQVGMLCLRLEFLSNSTVFPGVFGGACDVTDQSNAHATTQELAHTGTLVPLSHNARRKGVETTLALHPELLIYSIRDDATDDELAGILEQLTTRIQNVVSTLTINLIRQRVQGAAQGSLMDLLLTLLGPTPSTV